MEISEIASVSGKGGLFKILKPTRTGVILESMDQEKKKLVAHGTHKVSVLSEISIYTTDAEGSVPLEQVLKAIHTEFKGDTGLDAEASKEELFAFLKQVLPNFDENQVYASDIKKLVTWYHIIAVQVPEILSDKKEKKETKKEAKEVKEDKKEEKPKAKKTTKAATKKKE